MFSMEGMVMHIRYLLTGAVAASLTAHAWAEPAKPAQPAKPQAQETAKPAVNKPAAVLLASAEQVQAAAPAVQEPAAAPAKRPRAARVTSCRCAGQSN